MLITVIQRFTSGSFAHENAKASNKQKLEGDKDRLSVFPRASRDPDKSNPFREAADSSNAGRVLMIFRLDRANITRQGKQS